MSQICGNAQITYFCFNIYRKLKFSFFDRFWLYVSQDFSSLGWFKSLLIYGSGTFRFRGKERFFFKRQNGQSVQPLQIFCFRVSFEITFNFGNVLIPGNRMFYFCFKEQKGLEPFLDEVQGPLEGVVLDLRQLHEEVLEGPLVNFDFLKGIKNKETYFNVFNVFLWF